MIARWLATTVTDWDAGGELLRRRRYGVIEASGGQAVAVHLRPWPKLLSWPEVWPVRRGYHARGVADRCLLYFNQPRRHPNFLALRYVVSTQGTQYATFRAALVALDRLAEVKGSDALLCDAANSRLSDRLLRRFGWEPHAPARWRRNFIKRFYGTYPTAAST
ncbi:MAG: hypothetical protein DCC67_07975 [Planctomycetota bacterium]|nr:MAG: hypothetical protein DCC67_07975 [Planctomycetota bacterium]